MTRRLTAMIGVGALVVTGAAFAAFPAEAFVPDSAPRQVEISIGQEGHLNLAGTGLVPLVIHGTEGVDATALNPGSISVGGDVEPVRTSTGAVIANLVDMDADGRDDLVVHVDQADLRRSGGLTSDVEQLTVSATADDGGTITGVGTVRPEVVLELKFVEALQVRGAGPDIYTDQGASLPGVDAALARYDAGRLSPFLTDAASRRLTANLADTGASGQAPNLASWYTLTLPADTDVTQALETLRALPAIGHAGPAPGMAPPPAVPEQPQTPDFRGMQRYFRSAAENGIDADFSRADPRIRGEGIKIVDLEYDWNEHHEDLQLPDPGTDVGGDAFEKYKGFNDQHGTAVLGILGALDND